MNAIPQILATVVPVFAIMALGFLYGRVRKLPAQALTDMLLWIFLPCLVLGSLGSHPIDAKELIQIGSAALLVMAGTGILATLLFSRRPECRALTLSSVFMNSANMAFPIALFAFGSAGLTRQVAFYVAVHVFHVTVGVGLARGKGGIREMFRLPLIYAAALALTLALTGHQIPPAISKPLALVGNATIPIMLLLLGERLGKTRIVYFALALPAALIRIVGGFAFGVLAVSLFDLNGTARAAVMIGAVMPSAVFNFVLGEKYRLHPELIATVVVVSTLISIFTTPLVLLFIGMD